MIAGEITIDFYRATHVKWEAEVNEKKVELAAIDGVEAVSIDDAMRILELASTAHSRFKNADSNQKHQLVGFMGSNSVWKNGKLRVELHEV